MATTENVVELTLGYSNTDKTRTYRFTVSDDNILDSIAANVNTYNANITDADRKVFISDDYDDTDAQNIVGALSGIIGARSIVTTEQEIQLL